MGIISRVAWALVFVGCVFDGVARAEETATPTPAGTAEIQLKNGTSMRGTIVAVEPEQRVIIIVAGEKSIIPWADVARIVDGPKNAATTESTTPAPQPVLADMPAKGMPHLHIESNWSDVELSRVDGDVGAGFRGIGDEYAGPQTLSKYVCRAPCDKLVDGRDGHRFFFTGPGMLPSKQFRIDQFDGNVTARVHGMGIGRFAGGVVLTGGGAMFALGGLMFFGFSALGSDKPTPDDPNPERTAREVRTIGLVLGGIGVASLVTGIVLLSAGATRVELIKTSRNGMGLVLDNGVLRF